MVLISLQLTTTVSIHRGPVHSLTSSCPRRPRRLSTPCSTELRKFNQLAVQAMAWAMVQERAAMRAARTQLPTAGEPGTVGRRSAWMLP